MNDDVSRILEDRDIIENALIEFRLLEQRPIYSAPPIDEVTRRDLEALLIEAGLAVDIAKQIINDTTFVLAQFLSWVEQPVVRSVLTRQLRQFGQATDRFGQAYLEISGQHIFAALKRCDPVLFDDGSSLDFQARWDRGHEAFDRAVLDDRFLVLLRDRANTLANKLASSTGKGSSNRAKWWLTLRLIQIWTERTGALPADTPADERQRPGLFQRWVDVLETISNPNDQGKPFARVMRLQDRIRRALAVFRYVQMTDAPDPRPQKRTPPKKSSRKRT